MKRYDIEAKEAWFDGYDYQSVFLAESESLSGAWVSAEEAISIEAERDCLAARVAILEEREKNCATMDEAEKIALFRALQEIAKTIDAGSDPSPADVVRGVTSLVDRVAGLEAEVEELRHMQLCLTDDQLRHLFVMVDRACSFERGNDDDTELALLVAHAMQGRGFDYLGVNEWIAWEKQGKSSKELGSYEHTFKVVLDVAVLSDSKDPEDAGTERLFYPETFHGHDDVEANTITYKHVGTIDTLPPDERKEIEQRAERARLRKESRKLRADVERIKSLCTDGDMAQVIHDAQSLATRAVRAFEKSLSEEEA
jgi:hypothetical protein